MVSVRTDEGVRNLHVWFASLIRLTGKVAEAQVAELSGVLRRSEGRIAAQATADLPSRALVSVTSLGPLRENLARAAQTTLDEVLARWRGRFRLEAVITSLYLTDGPVGRERAAEHWW